MSTYTSSKTKALLALFVFIILFVTLGLPFASWGFKTDDWGNVYHSIISSWQEFFNFFVEGNSETAYHPCNLPAGEQAFFQGLYRPMSFVYYFVQYCIFGTQPYGYFLVTIALHAANAALLFIIFSHYTHTTYALCAALLFGFHPSLYNWIGWTSAQTYFIEMFILLLIFFALHAYVTTHRWRYYILACVLFLANLFLKEQSIFLPVLITMAGLWLSFGFWVITTFYIVTRLQLFPLTAATKTLTFEPTLHSFITRMSSRFYDFVSYGSDIIGLSWLPQGNPLIKGCLILLVASLGCYGFVLSRNKRLIAFSILGMLLASWPALLMHYQPRYIYLALPWALFIGLLMMNKQKISRIGTVLCTLLILFNACFLIRHLSIREKTLNTITQAFHTFVDNSAIHNCSLCFIAPPPRWFHEGSAQAIWMLRGNSDYPVYQYNAPIHPGDGNVSGGIITFERNGNFITCTSTNPNALWFTDEEERKHEQVTITLEDYVAHDNPLLVVWDYEQQQFRVLDE